MHCSREFSGSHSHMMNGGAREGVDLPLPSSIIRSISGDYANDKNALFEHFLPEMR